MAAHASPKTGMMIPSKIKGAQRRGVLSGNIYQIRRQATTVVGEVTHLGILCGERFASGKPLSEGGEHAVLNEEI